MSVKNTRTRDRSGEIHLRLWVRNPFLQHDAIGARSCMSHQNVTQFGFHEPPERTGSLLMSSSQISSGKSFFEGNPKNGAKTPSQ
jgi:hypothetical protein